MIYDGHFKWQPKCHHKVFGHELSLCARVHVLDRVSRCKNGKTNRFWLFSNVSLCVQFQANSFTRDFRISIQTSKFGENMPKPTWNNVLEQFKEFCRKCVQSKAMHKIGTRVEKCMRDQINSASGIHSNHTLVAVIRLHFSMCTLGVSAHTHRFVYLVVELKIGMCFAECNQHPHPIQIFIWIWMFFGIFFFLFRGRNSSLNLIRLIATVLLLNSFAHTKMVNAWLKEQKKIKFKATN